MKKYSYNNYNEGWYDHQTNRWISRDTLMKRTGLPNAHVLSFENGRDGNGYKMTKKQREAAEKKLGVVLT